jgi:hypothetical protein
MPHVIEQRYAHGMEVGLTWRRRHARLERKLGPDPYLRRRRKKPPWEGRWGVDTLIL